MQKIQIPVYTIILGRAYSGAGIIAISGESGHRYMFKDATIMLHEPRRFGISGIVDRKKALEVYTKLDNGTNNLVRLIKSRCKLTEAKIRKFLTEEKIFTAKEALEAGLIDKIVTAKTLTNELGRTLTEITKDLPPTISE